MGSISLRKFIRWLPDEASEPTSTVVVTSVSRCFVDIRVLRPKGQEGSWPIDEEKLPLDHVDWLIAGTSSSWKNEGEDFSHGRWEHWIDSRVVDASGIADEGLNYAQPDGSTLERGTMKNPATGKETEYEELWYDLTPQSTMSRGVVKSMVLKLDTSSEAKGLVVRYGQYCQGFLRRGQKLAAERWEWTEVKGWRRTISIGKDDLPCSIVLDENAVYREGDVHKVGDDTWLITEAIGFSDNPQ